MSVPVIFFESVIKRLVIIIILLYCLSVFDFGIKAIAQPVCLLDQITDTNLGESRNPSINSNGTRISFESPEDLTGENLDRNLEIFLFDTNSAMFTQITDTIDGSNFQSYISLDGTRIAFNSQNDIKGENPEEVIEIFLFDTAAGVFTQVTDTEGEGINVGASPSLNSDGTRMVFETDNDLTGDNADGNHEIFLFDTSISVIMQITDTSGPGTFNSRPAINSDGTMIVFTSNVDLTGDNMDTNSEIFLFDTNAMMPTQITETTDGSNIVSSVSSDGAMIAFRSTADLTGDNPDGNSEIFLFDAIGAMFTQITDTAGEAQFANTSPVINSDGTRIAFQSNRDLTGDNVDGNEEIFLFDVESMSLTQITDTLGSENGAPAINSDGTRIAFQSTSDLTGGNPDNSREIFLARCFDGLIPGDANADGLINILDVTAILNDILGISPVPGDGDCNEDEQVNILDVTCVLNIILGG